MEDFSSFVLILHDGVWKNIFSHYRCSGDKLTLLHIAITFGTVEFVKHLVRKLNYPVYLKSWNEWTPLHTAAFSNNVKSFEVLLLAGAGLHAYDIDGLTPYGVALVYNRKAIIQYYYDERLSREVRSVRVLEKTEEQKRKQEQWHERLQKEHTIQKLMLCQYMRYMTHSDGAVYSFPEKVFAHEPKNDASLYDEILVLEYRSKENESKT
jgi:hypothetical protein